MYDAAGNRKYQKARCGTVAELVQSPAYVDVHEHANQAISIILAQICASFPHQ